VSFHPPDAGMHRFVRAVRGVDQELGIDFPDFKPTNGHCGCFRWNSLRTPFSNKQKEGPDVAGRAMKVLGEDA
jgi:hypothetical protein